MMTLKPSGDRMPSHFDRKNFAFGVVVSAVLVGLLGDAPIIFFGLVTLEGEGVSIGDAMLGTVGALLASSLGAAFTALRARQRESQPMREGIAAGLAGLTIAVLASGYLFAGYLIFARNGSPWLALEVLNLLPIVLIGLPAAYAGAALGSFLKHKDQA